MQPECTKDVADCFPHLLPALISMAILGNNISSLPFSDKDDVHRLNCVILGKLINLNQDLLEYVFIICVILRYIYNRIPKITVWTLVVQAGKG